MRKLLLLLLLLPSIASGYTEHEIRKVSDTEYTSLTKQIEKLIPMLDRTHNLCYVTLTMENSVWTDFRFRGPWFLFTNAECEKIFKYIGEEKKKAEKYNQDLFLTYWANWLEVSIILY